MTYAEYDKLTRQFQEALAKYGDNYWWQSNDPAEIIRYQATEPVLLVNFKKLHESLETVLDRPVHTGELMHPNRWIWLMSEARDAVEKMALKKPQIISGKDENE